MDWHLAEDPSSNNSSCPLHVSLQWTSDTNQVPVVDCQSLCWSHDIKVGGVQSPRAEPHKSVWSEEGYRADAASRISRPCIGQTSPCGPVPAGSTASISAPAYRTPTGQKMSSLKWEEPWERRTLWESSGMSRTIIMKTELQTNPLSIRTWHESDETTELSGQQMTPESKPEVEAGLLPFLSSVFWWAGKLTKEFGGPVVKQRMFSSFMSKLKLLQILNTLLWCHQTLHLPHHNNLKHQNKTWLKLKSWTDFSPLKFNVEF